MKRKTVNEKFLLACERLDEKYLNNLSAYTLNNLSADTLKNLSAYTLNNLSAYTLNNLSAYTIKNLSADTINNLSADTIKNLSADTIKNLSADTINNLSAYTLKNLSAYTLKNLSAYTLNNLSAYTLKNLSADTLNNLSVDTLKNLSADTLNNLSADTLKNLSAECLYVIKEKIADWETIPKLDKPYTHLLADIKAKNRIHDQSTFGEIEEFSSEANVCGTPMCTAGHLVNMAGEIGYKLKAKYGWTTAAKLIHLKTHPDQPVQNFGSIPQSWALAYIKEMARIENE